MLTHEIAPSPFALRSKSIRANLKAYLQENVSAPLKRNRTESGWNDPRVIGRLMIALNGGAFDGGQILQPPPSI